MKEVKVATIIICFALSMSCKSQKAEIQTDEAPTMNKQRKGPPSVEKVFEMDTDGDGFLSKTEVKGRIAKDFDKIDANTDGLISKQEFENAPKPQRKGRGSKI